MNIKRGMRFRFADSGYEAVEFIVTRTAGNVVYYRNTRQSVWMRDDIPANQITRETLEQRGYEVTA